MRTPVLVLALLVILGAVPIDLSSGARNKPKDELIKEDTLKGEVLEDLDVNRKKKPGRKSGKKPGKKPKKNKGKGKKSGLFKEFRKITLANFDNEIGNLSCSNLEVFQSSHEGCGIATWLKCLNAGCKDGMACKKPCKNKGKLCSLACVKKKIDQRTICKNCVKHLLKAICCHFIGGECCIKTDSEDTGGICCHLDTTPTTPTNLVVTGGEQPSTEKSSEVISSENVCSQSIPPLLTGFQQLSTSIFFNNSIWVCGGYPWVKKTCQILKAGASQWTYGPGLKVERHRHTIIKAGDELIAMGGWKGISSMEKISLASGEWTVMSETMPRGRQDHCSVYFPKTKSVVLTGGWPFTKQTDSFNVVSGQWTQLDPLPKELQQHGCITMGQSILVAGGRASDNKLQKNVYRLNMINGKNWQTFGQLTVAKSYFTMGFVDNKLMIAGGYNDDGLLATIDTMEESGVWKESKLSLSVPRYLFAGTMVPTEAFPCPL